MTPQRTDARNPDVTTLSHGVRAGDRTVLARAITLVESKRADHQAAARRLVQAHAAAVRPIGELAPKHAACVETAR